MRKKTLTTKLHSGFIKQKLTAINMWDIPEGLVPDDFGWTPFQLPLPLGIHVETHRLTSVGQDPRRTSLIPPPDSPCLLRKKTRQQGLLGKNNL